MIETGLQLHISCRQLSLACKYFSRQIKMICEIDKSPKQRQIGKNKSKTVMQYENFTHLFRCAADVIYSRFAWKIRH
jgi:hypothetical protein